MKRNDLLKYGLTVLTASTALIGAGGMAQAADKKPNMFTFAPAGAYVAQWLTSFRDFPPRQKPGSFSLDRVMEAMTAAHKGSN